MDEKIISILEGIKPEIRDHLNIAFVSENILDSLDVMNLIVALEEAFSIEMDPEEVVTDNFESVEAIASLVAKYNKGAHQ